MEHTLLNGINSKIMQAYLGERTYKKLYWPLFFPLKATMSLKYEALIGSKGNAVAADVVSYNASAPLKTRRVVNKLTGMLQPIMMKRKMETTDIMEYNSLHARADADQKVLLNMVFDDPDACVVGVNTKMEWLTGQILSQGKVTLSKANNAGIITENAIDFRLPTANKEVAASADRHWSATTPTTMTPIADIETICTEAGAAGSKIRYIIMNRTKWQQFRGCDEVQNLIPYALYNGSKVARAPTLEMVNNFLSGEDRPQIILFDTYLTLETEEHVQSSVNPWTTKYVTFLPEMPCGNMLHCKGAEETNPPKQVIQAKKGPILISKYSDVDPVTEFTKGEIYAFPIWVNIDQSWIMNTESHTSF